MKGFIQFLLGLVAGLAIAFAVSHLKPQEIAVTQSANSVEQSYELADFTGVKVGSAFNAVISHGEFGVTIKVPEEILPYIKAEVSDGILTIGTRGNVKLNPKIANCKAFIYLPELRFLSASGASSVLAGDFTGSEVDVESSGAADIELGGDLARITIKSSGASSVNLKGLAEQIAVQASGASGISLAGEGSSLKIAATGASNVDADDFAAESISIEASGASKVYYKEAASENIRTSGSAVAKKK